MHNNLTRNRQPELTTRRRPAYQLTRLIEMLLRQEEEAKASFPAAQAMWKDMASSPPTAGAPGENPGTPLFRTIQNGHAAASTPEDRS